MPTMAPQIVLAFDLYGTLLSTASIATKLAEYVGTERAAEVAATWRTLQLEYTWRLNSMQKYEPFSTVTERSLVHALRQHSCTLSDDQLRRTMEQYYDLSAFADAPPALKALAGDDSFHPLVFSNGAADMLTGTMRASADLAPLADTFRDVVSADMVRVFKPDPRFYTALVEHVGMKAGRVWLVSSNPFDVVGARAAGLNAIWINRDMGRRGWEDNLIPGPEGGPTLEVSSLEHVCSSVAAWVKEHGA